MIRVNLKFAKDPWCKVASVTYLILLKKTKRFLEQKQENRQINIRNLIESKLKEKE